MTQHPSGEEIQDLLDGRLPSARRTEIEAHVVDCTQCRQEFAAISWARQAAAWLPAHEPPPDLRGRVALALDREARRAAPAAKSRRRLIWAMPFAAAATVAIVLLVRRGPVDLPAEVARAYSAYETAALPLDTATGEGPALEAFFSRHGITFPTRVFDLAMMGYRLVGGRTHTLGRRPSALFVYRTASGRPLICQMYEGTLAQLPAGGETREHNAITFRVHRSGVLTLVFWQEGDVVCVLVSKGSTDDVVQLAYAKAVKV